MPLVEANPNYFPEIPNVAKEYLKDIKEWAELQAKENLESCGLIFKNNDLLRLVNTHPYPDDNFRFSIFPNDIEDVKLIWHSHFKDSHPAKFTIQDLNLAHNTNIPQFLYHVGFKSWDYYEPSNPNPYPLSYNPNFNINELEFYLNWRFEWGRSDCFALVRRYFLGVLNIDIGEFSRPDTPPLQIKDWTFEGLWDWEKTFQKLPLNTSPELHDIFGIALRGGKKANHLAVMVDPEKNLILHITGERTRSRLDIFDESWRNLVVEHGRLK
jgi:hypothetical protein